MGKDLKHMVGFTKREMSFILDCIDLYARGEERCQLPMKKLVGDVRERLVLARYGRLKRTEIPAIRRGKRVPIAVSVKRLSPSARRPPVS
jgi:hypothetical protein